MKALVFCILTVGCFALVLTSPTDEMQKRKLEHILEDIQKLRRTLKNKEQMVNTPPRNIEDCCHLSALECFRDTLKSQFQIPNITYRRLGSPLTKNGVNFCSTNSTTSCTECTSHPKETAVEFFNRLESLIQKGIARLKMK